MNEFAGSLAGKDLADFTGIPRHVSAEGCQFMAIGSLPEVGQSLMVMVDSGHQLAGQQGPGQKVPGLPVSGQVRWVVDNRFALVFDRALARPLGKALENHGRLLGAVKLYRM